MRCCSALSRLNVNNAVSCTYDLRTSSVRKSRRKKKKGLSTSNCGTIHKRGRQAAYSQYARPVVPHTDNICPLMGHVRASAQLRDLPCLFLDLELIRGKEKRMTFRLGLQRKVHRESRARIGRHTHLESELLNFRRCLR